MTAPPPTDAAAPAAPLPREELVALVERWVGLPRYLARKFCVRESDYDDLLSVGMEALWVTALKYDPARARFSTIAFIRIKCRLKQHLDARRALKRQTDRRMVRLDLPDRESGLLPRDAVPGKEPDPDQGAVVAEILAALRCLPRRQRRIIEARLVGDDLRTIVAREGISHERVRGIIKQARQRLAVQLRRPELADE